MARSTRDELPTPIVDTAAKRGLLLDHLAVRGAQARSDKSSPSSAALVFVPPSHWQTSLATKSTPAVGRRPALQIALCSGQHPCSIIRAPPSLAQRLLEGPKTEGAEVGQFMGYLGPYGPLRDHS